MLIPTSIVIEGHILGDWEHGIWCPTCALPSAHQVTILWAYRHNLSPAGRCHMTVCTDCGHRTYDDPRWPGH